MDQTYVAVFTVMVGNRTLRAGDEITPDHLAEYGAREGEVERAIASGGLVPKGTLTKDRPGPVTSAEIRTSTITSPKLNTTDITPVSESP